jgi:hypothetical protein
MLNFLAKAEPMTFTPSLQIDSTGARLLIEALSGRWNYDKNRRDKRNIWYYVASPFSLVVARATAGVKRPEKAPVVKTKYQILGKSEPAPRTSGGEADCERDDASSRA